MANRLRAHPKEEDAAASEHGTVGGEHAAAEEGEEPPERAEAAQLLRRELRIRVDSRCVDRQTATEPLELSDGHCAVTGRLRGAERRKRASPEAALEGRGERQQRTRRCCSWGRGCSEWEAEGGYSEHRIAL